MASSMHTYDPATDEDDPIVTLDGHNLHDAAKCINEI